MNKRKSLHISYGIVILVFLVSLTFGSRVVTTFVESQPPERTVCLVLDAGHGGLDGGATSCTGKLESAFNLEITLTLRDLFHLLGYQTKMVRTTDSSVYTKGDTIAQKKVSDLKERVRIVNETEKPILISIHQNNFTDSRYSGAQVFYAKTPGSEDLAKSLQNAFLATINPGSHRNIKKSHGIYLMDHVYCPAVLIECGFLSNPAEEAKLRDPKYQRQIACVIASTLSTYLSNT